MFSPNVHDSPKLIDQIFIVGLKDIELDVIINKNPFQKEVLKPEILFTFPKTKSSNFQEALVDIAFPNGLEVSFFEEKPKMYSIVLTNEKAIRSYVYILQIYDRMKLSEEDLKNPDISKLSISSSTAINKTFFCPVAICLISYISDIEFFRGILLEIYKIIFFNKDYLGNEINDNTIQNRKSKSQASGEDNTSNNTSTLFYINKELLNFQKLELLNYFNLLTEILKPPTKAELILNLRFSSFKFVNSSKLLFPRDNLTIKQLFNYLELSAIITLYTALLFENNVIIIGNQQSLLFSICEALTQLIFPLRWLHAYIPNLPGDQLGFLGCPSPYLMGVLSSNVDAKELISEYPQAIICEISTSQIYGTLKGSLPKNEEANIRTKILFLKNNNENNFCGDDVIIDGCNHSDKNLFLQEYEDVSFKRSFSENVQFIFSRIFRNYSNQIKENFINNNYFNNKKFLESFDDDDYKNFFEKLCNTLAFEYFVTSFQYLDDSNSRKFKYLCANSKNDTKDSDSCNYSYEISSKTYFDFEKAKEEEETVLNHYNEISTKIDDYKEKLKNADANSTRTGTLSKNNYDSGNVQQMSFYHQEYGFFLFLNKFKYNINPHKELCEKILEMYKPINDYFSLGTAAWRPPNRKNTTRADIEDLRRNSNFYEKFVKYNNTPQLIKMFNDHSVQFYNIILLYLSFYKLTSNEEIVYHFSKSYDSDKIEFPRNLYFMYLGLLNQNELKALSDFTINKNNIIHQAIICRLRILEKKGKLKTMVINSNDSDDELQELNEISTGNNREIRRKYTRKYLNKENEESPNQEQRKRRKSGVMISLINFDKNMVNTNENENEIDLDACKKTLNELESNDNQISFIQHNGNYNMMKRKSLSTKPSDNDPLVISEDICIRLYKFLLQLKINKIESTKLDNSYLREISQNPSFKEIKKLILSLENISLLRLSQNPVNYYCFWLNMYNFLTIYSVIYKSEVSSVGYDWYMFLKNSNFSIGKSEISLYEIENNILRNKDIEAKIYGKVLKPELENVPLIDKYDKIINYGITLPTISSPCLRIYFPFNLMENLKLNAIEFFSRNIKLDFTNNVLTIPEYLTFIEPEFSEHISDYSFAFPDEFINYVKNSKNYITAVEKYNWKLSFENIKNLENII